MREEEEESERKKLACEVKTNSVTNTGEWKKVSSEARVNDVEQVQDLKENLIHHFYSQEVGREQRRQSERKGWRRREELDYR